MDGFLALAVCFELTAFLPRNFWYFFFPAPTLFSARPSFSSADFFVFAWPSTSMDASISSSSFARSLSSRARRFCTFFVSLRAASSARCLSLAPAAFFTRRALMFLERWKEWLRPLNELLHVPPAGEMTSNDHSVRHPLATAWRSPLRQLKSRRFFEACDVPNFDPTHRLVCPSAYRISKGLQLCSGSSEQTKLGVLTHGASFPRQGGMPARGPRVCSVSLRTRSRANDVKNGQSIDRHHIVMQLAWAASRGRPPLCKRVTSSRWTNKCQASSSGPSDKPVVDVVLSSGFLAFGSHCGFLQAVVDANLDVAGIMGTSSGALVGSLFAAGLTPLEILDEFGSIAPIERIQLNKEPWRGVFNLSPAINRLRELVPEKFEDLAIQLAVGVVSSRGGTYELITSGSLPEAVVASAAVPVLFAPVSIPGQPKTPHVDGGLRSRVGLDAWRGLDRRANPAAVHVVGRSSPFSGSSAVSSGESDSDGDVHATETGANDVLVVHSKRSKSSLWNLDKGRLRAHFDASYETARLEIEAGYSSLVPDRT